MLWRAGLAAAVSRDYRCPELFWCLGDLQGVSGDKVLGLVAVFMGPCHRRFLYSYK
jgi:hypothetical protein